MMMMMMVIVMMMMMMMMMISDDNWFYNVDDGNVVDDHVFKFLPSPGPDSMDVETENPDAKSESCSSLKRKLSKVSLEEISD